MIRFTVEVTFRVLEFSFDDFAVVCDINKQVAHQEVELHNLAKKQN